MPEKEANATASAVLIDGVADWLMSQALGEAEPANRIRGAYGDIAR